MSSDHSTEPGASDDASFPASAPARTAPPEPVPLDLHRRVLAGTDQGFCLVEVLRDGQGHAVDYRFLEVNAAFERHTAIAGAAGRTARELTGQIDPHWLAVYERVAARGERESLVERCAILERWLEVEAFPVGAPGRPLVAVLFREVTERMRAEAALRESEARFRAMADGLPLIVWVHDAEGRQQFVNRTFREFFGVSEEERASGTWQVLMHPEDADAYREEFLACTRERRPFHAQVRVRRADGAWRWLESWGRPRFTVDDRFLGLVGTSADVTERRRVEEDLQTSEARYRELVENANSAILRWRRDGTISFFNEHAERVFGYAAGEVLGRPVGILLPESESGGRDLGALIADIAAHPERHVHEVNENVTRDGRRIWMVWTNRPIRDARGELEEMLAVGSDITELKRAEMALKEADRRKDEFLATLAHELRNPLAPLKTGVELLRRQGGAAAGGEPRALDMMERQLDHLVRLVDDLLDVSRVTRGKIELQREAVDLAEVVDAALEISARALERGERGIQVRRPPEPLVVEGDRVRLVQVVANLLNNAAKFTGEEGRIRVSAARAGDMAELSVRDDGEGIAPELLPRVFEVFAQAGEGRGGGLGIGLTLVRSLVEMHGGRVEAHSEGPGRGADFVAYLPLTREPAAPSPSEERDSDTQLPPHRALVVDDNRDAADSLGMLLEVMGMQAHVVYDGPAALEALDAGPADVVFLDIGMPGMDGYQVARAIRTRHGGALLLVAVTGWGQEEDRRRVQAAGFDHHLIKPIALDALEEVVAGVAG